MIMIFFYDGECLVKDTIWIWTDWLRLGISDFNEIFSMTNT